MSGTGGKTFKVALIQNCAAREMEPSLAEAEALARAAAKDGADLSMATEMVEMVEPDPAAVLREVGRAACRERGCTYVWISAGADALKKNINQKMLNKQK